MNKTFTINLNGRVYHINDDAFDMLNNYLDKLKQRFSKEEGSQEIMDDIEARIGELFTERMRYGMNVICISDVEDMIKVMGEPEQYDEEISIEEEKTSEVSEKSENKSGNINDTTGDKKTKKLFRDPDHRVIAGVCAGLGSYTGIDPIILRLVFIISFFCLYGSTILVYVLFWIFIPEARTVAQKLQMKGANLMWKISDRL